MDQQDRMIASGDAVAAELRHILDAARKAGSNLPGVETLLNNWSLYSAPYRRQVAESIGLDGYESGSPLCRQFSGDC